MKFNIGDIFRHTDTNVDDAHWLVIGLIHDEDGLYYKIIPLDEFDGNTNSGYFTNDIGYTDKYYVRAS